MQNTAATAACGAPQAAAQQMRAAAGLHAWCDTQRAHTSRAACAGVPTVWLNLLQHVGKHGLRLRHLKRLCVAGSAAPRAMIEALEAHGVDVRHMYGPELLAAAAATWLSAAPAESAAPLGSPGGE